jgi:TRAP-type C4-dicarboxylate transport system substrate-binding protein
MTSDLMVNSINAMGAIATPMGQGDVYSALQQGILDGWENSPTTLYTLKLYEVSSICPLRITSSAPTSFL